MNIEALRGRLGYQVALLGGVVLLATTLLSQAHHLTAASIAAAEARDLQASLAQVLPAGSFDNELAQDFLDIEGAQGPVRVYRARQGGRVVAVVMQLVAPNGYAGPIELVMGVDKDGQVLGVRVLKHKETPGLTDQIDAGKGDWIFSFNGKDLGHPPPERWAVKKDGGDFDQFTGATITPRAIVGVLKGGLELFAAQRARLLDEAPATPEGQAS